MKDWVFIALVGAAMIHIFEEYVFPGGFADALKNLLPKSAHLFTSGFHWVVNGLFLLLCIGSALIGRSQLVLSMSIFSLVFVNAVLHIRGSILKKGYYPGVISAVFLYIPLAVYAYPGFLGNGQLNWLEGLMSGLLGVLFMGVLMCYVLLSQDKHGSKVNE
jgi:hypothetical protein